VTSATTVSAKKRVDRRPGQVRIVTSEYCYNCGSTGACKQGRDRYREDCIQSTRPLTPEAYKLYERLAAVEVMTSAQRAEVLRWFVFSSLDRFDSAVDSIGPRAADAVMLKARKTMR